MVVVEYWEFINSDKISRVEWFLTAKWIAESIS